MMLCAASGGFRKAVRRRFWAKLFRRERALLACFLVAIGCLIGIPLAKPLLIKAGLGVTAIVTSVALLFFAIFRLAFSPARPTLPARECALKDRKRMDEYRVALAWHLWLLYIPNSEILTYRYASSVTGQQTETMILMVYYFLLAAILQITVARRLRRDYLRTRAAIDQFLSDLTGEDSNP